LQGSGPFEHASVLTSPELDVAGDARSAVPTRQRYNPGPPRKEVRRRGPHRVGLAPTDSRVRASLGILLVGALLVAGFEVAPSAAGDVPTSKSVDHHGGSLGSTELAAARASLIAGGGPISSANVPSVQGWRAECSPCQRALPSLAYDAADHVVLLFGGFHVVGGKALFLNETWTYGNGSWTKLHIPVSPSPRATAAMTWDSTDGYVLLFGGTGPNATFRGWFTDTWSFVGGAWTRLATSSHPPPVDPVASEYSGGHEVILLGGTGSALNTPTWAFAAGVWTNVTKSGQPALFFPALSDDPTDAYVVAFGGVVSTNTSSCHYCNETWTFSAGGWNQITNLSLGHPSGRLGAAMWFDSGTGRIDLFGGGTGSGKVLNDTWEFSAGVWSLLHPGRAPSPRSTLATFDSYGGYAVLFGGSAPRTHGGSILFGDTWNFSGGRWSAVNQPLPSGGYGRSFAFDNRIGGGLMFGGNSGGVLSNETWLHLGNTWARLLPIQTPSARVGSMMAYDTGLGAVVLFGGFDGSLRNDTWLFSAGNWTLVHPATAPQARDYGGMAFDPRSNRTVLFGGNIGGFAGDTWTFHLGVWKNLSSGSRFSPSPRYGESLSYDGADQTLVLFGGFDGGYLGDTWSFRGGNWTLGTPLFPPSPRLFASASYDPAKGSVILFGGYNGTTLNDTWAYVGGAWTKETPSVSPPTRELASMIYDPALRALVLFGGIGVSPVGPLAWHY
jgi:galactose oxidase-like protein